MSNGYKTSFSDRFFLANKFLVESEVDYSSTVTMWNLIDLTQLQEFQKKNESEKPSYTALIAKAIALTLKEYPELNKRFYRPFGFGPTRYQKFDTVDISIASEVKDPRYKHIAYIGVLTDVDTKSLSEIRTWLFNFRETEMVEQWKNFKGIIDGLPHILARFVLSIPRFFPSLWKKYRGGVTMISSPAKYGVDGLVAAWPAPIGVSFGFVKKRAIVKDDKIVMAETFNLVLNFDRRLITGAQGAQLFHRISERSERLEKADFN